MTTHDDVEIGWSLLEEGDLDGARQAHERVRHLAPDNPEVIALGGAIASLSGDIDAALAAFLRAAELEPDNTRHLVHAAELYLAAHDDAESAIALCDRVLEATEDEDDLIDTVLLKAEALASMEDREEEAREVLNELDGCAIDDPVLLCRTGDLLYSLGDLDAAERVYLDAVELDEAWGDAFHGLGMVYEARGDTGRMIQAWLRTREIDLTSALPPWHLDQDAFEVVAERALAELPEEVRDKLANVPVLIEDAPSEEHVRAGMDPRLLGLFMGVPLPHKSHLDGVPQLDTVHLFQNNLERASHDLEHLEDEIRITVLHETAHFFGLEDEDLHEMGLG